MVEDRDGKGEIGTRLRDLRIMKIRQHIVFHGWVQGVGFRYRAVQAAQRYGATGWVRNESDGSVTMEIQGTQEQIDSVIMAVERGTYVNIDRMDVKTIPVKEEERGFRPCIL